MRKAILGSTKTTVWRQAPSQEEEEEKEDHLSIRTGRAGGGKVLETSGSRRIRFDGSALVSTYTDEVKLLGPHGSHHIVQKC